MAITPPSFDIMGKRGIVGKKILKVINKQHERSGMIKQSIFAAVLTCLSYAKLIII